MRAGGGGRGGAGGASVSANVWAASSDIVSRDKALATGLPDVFGLYWFIKKKRCAG